MTDIPLTQASAPQLAAAVEDNLFALFRAMTHALPDSILVEGDDLSHHLAFPSNPMFKGVWRTRLTPDTADAAIDQTLAWYKAHNAPFLFWWIGPDTQPADLPARLQARGFMVHMAGDPGMAADLHTLPATIPTPAGFTIVHASDQKTLEDWRDVFCTTYEVPAFAGQAWVDATLRAGPNAPWQMYLGYLNGQPVATNILFKGAGVAGVYGVGTVPGARGQGIGAAITLQPLLDARALGYRYGVLFSTELGHSVYRRLGFYDVSCKIGRYLWFNG